VSLLNKVVRGNRHQIFRLVSTTESFGVYLMILLLEGYTMLFGVALVDVLILVKIELSLVGVTEAVVLVLVLQTVGIWDIRKSPEYVYYLATLASRDWGNSYSNFSTNLHFLRLHLHSLFRIGNHLSGGRFDNLVLYSFKPSEQEEFGGRCRKVIVRSIILDMAERASEMSDSVKHNPFTEYSLAIEPILSTTPVRVSGLRDFIVNRYSSVSQKFKTPTKNRSSIVEGLERYPELAKLIVWGIILLVVSIVSVLLETRVPW